VIRAPLEHEDRTLGARAFDSLLARGTMAVEPMRYRVHRPAPPLDGFIDYLWSLSDVPEHARERIVPTGTIELVVNLVEDEFEISGSAASDSPRRFSGAIVSGCYSAPFEFDTRVHAAVMGVHFKPGGAAGFLGAAPGDLADTHVSLEDLWGPLALELRERLCVASSARHKFQILEHALRLRLARRREPRGAVEQALVALSRPGVDVGRVTAELQLSRRRLIEIFTEDVGMTPKRYLRVRRFQRALAAATAIASPHWAELAIDCGYFDQAHLCRDWLELTGVTPSEFVALRRRPVKESHLAVLDEGVKSFQDASGLGA
jgi:AraC-like DNA-binding protein